MIFGLMTYSFKPVILNFNRSAKNEFSPAELGLFEILVAKQTFLRGLYNTRLACCKILGGATSGERKGSYEPVGSEASFCIASISGTFTRLL